MNAMIYKKKGPLVLFLVPTFLFLAMYLYYPFLMNIYNSLNKIGGLGESSRGLNEPVWENYVKMFTDPLMRTALKNTMILMILTVVFQVGIALVLALMVDNIKVGAKFFRTVYFFPIVISATALGLLFNLIFLYDGGMLNQLLQNLGLAAENIDWKDPAHFFVTMMVPVIWQYVGFYFVILVTGLNNISTDIYEAAEIDGASGLGRIRYITLPLLHNTLCTCLVLAITGSLKGGLFYDTQTLSRGKNAPLCVYVPVGAHDDLSFYMGHPQFLQAARADPQRYILAAHRRQIHTGELRHRLQAR